MKIAFIQFLFLCSCFYLPGAEICGDWNFDSGQPLVSAETGLTLRGNAAIGVPGIVGKGVAFNGKNQYLEVIFPENNRPREEMTLQFWFKPAPDSFLYPAVRHRNTTVALDGGAGFFWYEVNTEDGKHYYNGLAHPKSPPPDRWYHIALVYSQSELRLYWDGELVAVSKTTGGILKNTNQPLAVGGRLSRQGNAWRGFFKGTIDELEIDNRAKYEFPRVRVLKLREHLRRLAKANDKPDAAWAEKFHEWDRKVEALLPGEDCSAIVAEGTDLKTTGLTQARMTAMRRIFGNDAPPDYAVGTYSSMVRILPDDFLIDAPRPELSFDLAANERENLQAVIFPASGPVDLEVRMPEEFTRDDGIRHKFRTSASLVEYLPLAKPSAFMPMLPAIPDRLKTGPRFHIEDGSNATLWLEVVAPPQTPAGRYRADAEWKTDKGTFRLPVELLVRNFELPRRSLAPSLINLWERDIQTYVKPGDSDGFAALLTEYGRMLLDHKLNPILLTNESLVAPWLRESVWPHYRANPDGTVSINWTYFDRIIDRLRAEGMSKIVIGPDYHLREEKIPENIRETNPAAIWKAVHDHAAERGYLADAVAYPLDEAEGNAALTKEITKILRENAPGLSMLLTSGCANYPSDEFPGIGLWIPQLQWTNPILKEKFQKEGIPVWTYVCTGPNFPTPNLHSDTPAAAIRMVPGAAMRFGYDGFLHWAANFNTRKGARTVTSYNAGEGTYIYAAENGAPVPTVRLKVLGDGMEDWNALLMLKARNPGRYADLKAKLDALIPARQYDRGIPITLTSPREASFKTFLDPNAFYHVYNHPERYLAWRKALYDALDATARKK